VLQVIDQVETVWGNVSDVAAVWIQDWTGQRNFTAATDLPRVGLWWNWEVGLLLHQYNHVTCAELLSFSVGGIYN